MEAALPDMPEPTTDPDPPRAPGGPDATLNESDPGATVSAREVDEPLAPEPPFSAQKDEEVVVPDAIQEPEEPDDVPEDADEAAEESTDEEPPA